MNSNYYRNKQAAIYVEKKPTKTDQSQVTATDINIIVNQFLRTGQSPGQQTPIYGDFTELPQDLKTMFELARSVREKVDTLPDELQLVPLDELVRMTPKDIDAILAKRTTTTTTDEKPKT